MQSEEVVRGTWSTKVEIGRKVVRIKLPDRVRRIFSENPICIAKGKEAIRLFYKPPSTRHETAYVNSENFLVVHKNLAQRLRITDVAYIVGYGNTYPYAEIMSTLQYEKMMAEFNHRFEKLAQLPVDVR